MAEIWSFDHVIVINIFSFKLMASSTLYLEWVLMFHANAAAKKQEKCKKHNVDSKRRHPTPSTWTFLFLSGSRSAQEVNANKFGIVCICNESRTSGCLKKRKSAARNQKLLLIAAVHRLHLGFKLISFCREKYPKS